MRARLPGVLARYYPILLLWLLFCGLILAVVLTLNLRDLESRLMQYGDAYQGELNQRMVSNEAVLNGFAALFAAVGKTDKEQVSRYARQVVANNPQIFSLEVVERVAAQRLADFVAAQRSPQTPHFTVKGFSYSGDRTWQPLQHKAYYYPIVFMEPMRPGSEQVLGLDVESVPWLARALEQAQRRQQPVASPIFRLVEGNQAFVTFMPVHLPVMDPAVQFVAGAVPLIDMVVDVASMFAPAAPLFAGGDLRVYQSASGVGRGAPVLHMAGLPRSWLERHVLPVLLSRHHFESMGLPFVVEVRKQVGWVDLNLGLLGLLLVGTLVSTAILVAYLRIHQERHVLRASNEQRLWRLANHDALTALPNRLLLLDRMEKARARALRQGNSFGVMFLDLDGFKGVNDTYGHAAGDELLKLVAERICGAVRAEDTVARISGDEFVVLVEGFESRQELQDLARKLQDRLTTPYAINGRHIEVRASAGCALYPEDGGTIDELLHHADSKMYHDKRVNGSGQKNG